MPNAIEVIRERSLPASPEEVWRVVGDAERLPEWFAFTERVEVLEGEGLGRRQRIQAAGARNARRWTSA